MSGDSEKAFEGLQSLNDRDSHRPASVGSRSSRSGSMPALINLSGQAGARERSPRGTGRGSDTLSGEDSFRPIRGRVSSRVSSPLPIADRHGFDENERRTQRRLNDDRASTETRVVPFEHEDELVDDLADLIPDVNMAADNVVCDQFSNGHWDPTRVDASSSLSGPPRYIVHRL